MHLLKGQTDQWDTLLKEGIDQHGSTLCKKFTAAEKLGSIVLPMQLNRVSYGSMCDGAKGLMDLPTVHCLFVSDG